MQAEHTQYAGVGADADARVPRFDAVEGRTRDPSSRGDHTGGVLAAKPGESHTFAQGLQLTGSCGEEEW